ncbi:hypothetical protein SAMN06265349_1011169 [Flavobacterium resistens]|uniref:Uncharacterized protein n=1 Tax=Flavobacterium resistens TaxID=443612 RepID=A0A521BL20_9FLAO|nr:hypothetical protein [Flavobacterium resistens]MRX67481.1 hypothetical protein [Flavobacterium resistens]SMO47847.1 hypothetical protein SAMN06265349_1011169 [Flavobacterium resistens]
MNKIEGIQDNSDYEDYWDFINYRIDNNWLDEKLDELYPNKMFKGLIPTLVYWMEHEEEKEVVWKRILPNENETTICPILMCPDDNDFSCTLIVAEIKNCGDLIQWNRIGIDKTKESGAEKIGSKVEWLDKLQEFNFSKQDYLVMLEIFTQQLAVDKLKIEEHLKEWNDKKTKT